MDTWKKLTLCSRVFPYLIILLATSIRSYHLDCNLWIVFYTAFWDRHIYIHRLSLNLNITLVKSEVDISRRSWAELSLSSTLFSETVSLVVRCLVWWATGPWASGDFSVSTSLGLQELTITSSFYLGSGDLKPQHWALWQELHTPSHLRV